MPKKQEGYYWPAMMLLASSLNVCGAVAAISLGVDKDKNGNTNPFFYTALSASLIYCFGNVMKVVEVCRSRSKSHVEQLMDESDLELTSISIGR